MAGVGKKGPVFVPPASAALLDKLSKAALMDIAWNLAALGTNETPEEVITHLAREAVLVASERGDLCPKALALLGKKRLEADPPDFPADMR